MVVTDLVAMLRDPEWRLPDSMRARARIVLSSFLDPDEPVSDEVPGLEFLDAAAVIEIAGAELQYELASYRKYRRYRETVVQGLADSEARPALEEFLVAKRRQLRARIQDKRPRVEAPGFGRDLPPSAVRRGSRYGSPASTSLTRSVSYTHLTLPTKRQA